MELSNEILLMGGTSLVTIGIAWGIVKGTLHNKVSWPEHRDICHEKSVELHDKIDSFRKDFSEQTGEILRAIGKLEGKLEK